MLDRFVSTVMKMPSCQYIPLGFFLASFHYTHACTYFEVRSASCAMVIANTNEWMTPISANGWRAKLHSRNEQIQPSCAEGDSWTPKLGYVAMGGVGAIADASFGANSMNEAGLAISEHAIRGVRTYVPKNFTITLCALDLATWITTNFETVVDVRNALTTARVLYNGSGTNSDPGAQWAIADAFGDSIVVEHVGGDLHIYDNRQVGVLTNDPEYPWQVRNLDNYVGLSRTWPTGGADITVDTEFGEVPVAVGHGQNLLGLPGDLSPPSRFVRTFFLRSYALKASPPTNLEDALALASGVLNTQHIVKGANARSRGEGGYDYTQFAVLKVPTQRLFYYRTYEASQWRLVNMSVLNFNQCGEARQSGAFTAIDVSQDLKRSKTWEI